MELMEERPSHASHASTGTFLDEDSRYHDSMQLGLVKCKGRICKVLVQADLEHAFFRELTVARKKPQNAEIIPVFSSWDE